MKLPRKQNIYLPLLKCLDENGGELEYQKALGKVKEMYPNLTEEAKASRLSTGNNRLNNRIAWARQDLVADGEIDPSVYGIWRITQKGKEHLESGWNAWKPEYVELKPRNLKANLRNQTGIREMGLSSYSIGSEGGTPREEIESLIEHITENVKEQLIQFLKKGSSENFEFVIGHLLEKMDYGSLSDGTIRITGRSGDGGVDGIFSLNSLGLGRAIFQAKKWEQNVGIEVVERLVGSVKTNEVNYGILITTSDYTAQARTSAEKAGSTIRLIDGREFAELMIQAELGVRKNAISVPEIDEEYFSGM